VASGAEDYMAAKLNAAKVMKNLKKLTEAWSLPSIHHGRNKM
jgi:hypothetical protein